MIGIRYDKPLSPEDRFLIDTVTTRYEGVEAPFVAFDRGDHIELRCPEKIRGAIPALGAKPDANEISAEAPSPVRLSNGEGASNG